MPSGKRSSIRATDKDRGCTDQTKRFTTAALTRIGAAVFLFLDLLERISNMRLLLALFVLTLFVTAGGCSSEPVVIEATPDQQKAFAEEYEKEMQSMGP